MKPTITRTKIKWQNRKITYTNKNKNTPKDNNT